jgi:hypothetical protein
MSSENPPLDKQAKARAKEAERLARRAATSARVREKIEKQQAEQELLRNRQLLAQRLDIAKLGIQSLTRESFGDSTKAFLVYLGLLEKAKNVGPGRLHPGLFDAQKDLLELILVTGIYWDLARTYDRVRGKQHFKEIQAYLNQFVVFAQGAPFKGLCSETLRKYLAADKAIHRGEFKAAYKRLGGDTCFIASALVDVSDLDTLPRLRRFRDHHLLRSTIGRRFVLWYERYSPRVVMILERCPMVIRRGVALLLDTFAWVVSRVQ